MRKFLLAVMVLVVVPYVPVTKAGFVNGNTLLTRCRNETDVYDQAYCLAYIVAITDTLWGKNAVQGYRACPLGSLVQGHALDIAVSWLEAHSRRRHLAANELVAAALSEAFPCKN